MGRRTKNIFLAHLVSQTKLCHTHIRQEVGDSESIFLRPITLSGKTLAIVARVFV